MRARLVAFLAVIVAFSSSAAELEEGRLRLTLHERSARFSLRVEQDGEWISLLFPEDVRTSVTEIRENNQVHRLGDSGRFSQQIEEGPYGPRFVWESATLRISQDFELIRGRDSLAVNAVQIRTSVESTAEEPREVGVRFLLDSWLGERQNTHFVLADGTVVDGELRVDPQETDYVTSRSTVSARVGLQVMLATDSVTVPEAVYLTNWQRASESPWDYQYNPTRNYNRLPFSINDSAILVLYPSRQLASGERYEVVTRIGDLAANGYADPQTVLAERQAEADAATDSDEPSSSVLMGRLTELIEEIAALSLTEEIEMAEITRLQQELQELGELIRRR